MTGTPSGQYGTLTYSGNLVISGSSSSTAIETIQQKSSTDTLTVENGAAISGATLDSSNVILDGGSISYSGSVNSTHTTITLLHDNNQGNNITLPNYDFSGNLTISGLSPADRVSVTYGTISSVSDVKSGEIAVKLDNGTVVNILTAINPATGTHFTASNFTYSGNELTCFLSGSMIKTPNGPIAVEDLRIGSEIVTFKEDIDVLRRVTWVGQAHYTVRPHLPDDEAGYPVRILKDAIADGVPFKDMLITAEHCLFFDGRFVPSRMLVNGRSIFFDKSITSYDYYHIETEDHSVIMADGMLTESYLDTGNRHAFTQKGNVVSIGSSRNLTWDDAAAPLGVSREFAEPLFRKIERRADKADIAIRTETRPLTNESALHLITDTGVPIRPAREYNGRIMFMIPAGVQSIRIASNASRPSDVIGPFVDDRRYFGVAVGDITLFEGNRSRAITAHLTDGELDGWNTLEWEDCRWTSGNGLLPLGERNPRGIALIAIQIRKTGPYLLTDTPRKEDAMRA